MRNLPHAFLSCVLAVCPLPVEQTPQIGAQPPTAPSYNPPLPAAGQVSLAEPLDGHHVGWNWLSVGTKTAPADAGNP